jgi:branched-chain amino acid transport system permease protein
MVLAFGGFTILWGAMLGAASLTFLNEYLTIFAGYKRAIYGLALIVIMLFFPNGLLEGLKDSARFLLQSARKGMGE